MPKGEINISELGSHYLTIGRIRKDAERFMVDADFIPPCTTMKSHPELQEYHAKFGNMFRSLENYSKIIIAKIHNRDNRGELGAHISLICREMLRYLATLQFTYTNKGLYNAPIDVLDSVSSPEAYHVCKFQLPIRDAKGGNAEIFLRVERRNARFVRRATR